MDAIDSFIVAVRGVLCPTHADADQWQSKLWRWYAAEACVAAIKSRSDGRTTGVR